MQIHGHQSQNGQGPPTWLDPPGQHIAEQIFQFQDRFECDQFTIDIDIEADPDPYVNANLMITNLTGAPLDIYKLKISLPIAPVILGGSLTGGSVSVNLMDENSNGATLTNIDANTPIYMARIDGVDYQSLMDSVSFSVAVNDTDVFGPERFGPTPTMPSQLGPAVLNTIEIELNATLSAYDSAAIFSQFVVIQDPDIPEPATMSLLAFGGMAVLARRRRRKA
jgi:hypothetical protein